jgi:GTP-binding protein EngB required for normal cell division
MSSGTVSGEASPSNTPDRFADNDNSTKDLRKGLQQVCLTPPTTSSSIPTPPSTIGPEDHIRPNNVEDGIPNEPYYDLAFQSAIRCAADTARKIANVLEDCPSSEPTISTLKEEAKSLSSYRSPPSRTIGLIGQSGHGKSSLINSLLNIEGLAVTGERGNAVTAFVIEYKYKRESQTSTFLVEASCLRPEEIDKQLEELLQQYRFPFICTPSDELSADEYNAAEKKSETAQCILVAAFSSFEGFDLESFKHQGEKVSLDILLAYSKRLQWPEGMRDGEWSGTAETVEECHELTMPFMDNGLWPFIQSMSLYLDCEVLQSGIILADLPGYHDVNYARERNAKLYQLRCEELFVVADIKRAIADPVIKEAVKSHISSAGKVGEISTPNVTIVCTHSASFPKSTQALKSTKNASKIKEVRAKIQRLGTQSLGTGLETTKILEEANFELTSISVEERNEDVREALQKAYAKMYGASRLSVYCVDNSLYWDYPDSLQAHAISGIPFLRRHTLSLPGKALFEFGENFLHTHVPAIVLSLQMWLDASNGNQTCALSDALVLDDWFSEFDAAVSTLRRKVASAYKQNIEKPLKTHQREVISAASEVCNSWRPMYHVSFRAFVAHHGTYTTHAVGFRCWNTELVDCLNDVTDHGWVQMDQNLEEAGVHLDSLFRQAFQSMREELTSAQAPASLMQNFVHREEQVSEVLAVNLRSLYRNYGFLKQLATSGGSGSFVLHYMSPIYDRCSRDSGKSSFSALLLQLTLTYAYQERE